MKGQDVVLLTKLAGAMERASLRDLAESVGFDLAGTQRSVQRLNEAGLYSPERRSVLLGAAEEFLIHAVKFSFPARWEGESRGVPTSWAAKPLSDELASGSGAPPVWAHAHGDTLGLALAPLHPIVPAAALADPVLHGRLSLLDALRSSASRRTTQLAESLLRSSLRHER